MMLRIRKYRVFLLVATLSLLTVWYFSRDAAWQGEGGDARFAEYEGVVPDAESVVQAEESRRVGEVKGEESWGKVGEVKGEEGWGRVEAEESRIRLEEMKAEQSRVRLEEMKNQGGMKAGEHLDGDEKEWVAPADEDELFGAGISTARAVESVTSTVDLGAVGLPASTTAVEYAEVSVTATDEMASSTSSSVYRTPTYTWASPVERFPLASGSTIQLPTGTPKAMPRIQHEFTKDEQTVKNERNMIREMIEKAMKRTWKGYKDHAWLKDEVRPVTGGYKDKFMGWAATLVDSLDTLWIMGMELEFEEAVAAVGEIDFTKSTHDTIPMFETTIRYLGGLIGAYDISGGKHKILLDKAVELAEVLMGAFDTPNRMPLLHYSFASSRQPDRAGTYSCLAEIGSLSVEFTRLAQITKEPKYYDAVARITDELEAFQMETSLPGLWPLKVDASGCAKPSFKEPTKASSNSGTSRHPPLPLRPVAEPPRKDISSFGKDREDAAAVEKDSKTPAELLRESATHTFAIDADARAPVDLRDPQDSIIEDLTRDGLDPRLQRRQLDSTPTLGDETVSDTTLSDNDLSIGTVTLPSSTSSKARSRPTATCIPGGFSSSGFAGAERFTLGGEADSTYEYLPKQYLLLGGNAEKYRTMYERAVNATKEYLLFRPMIPDSKRSVLLAGGYYPYAMETPSIGRVNGSLDSSIGHLTCFAGGMFALGAKIFNRPEDLEIGAKLTDACVWAYEQTATGIMPEDFKAMPCDNMDNCAWNETAWHMELDPAASVRDEMAQKALDQQAAAAAAAAEIGEGVDLLKGAMPGAPPRKADVRLDDFGDQGHTKRQLSDAVGDPTSASLSIVDGSSSSEPVAAPGLSSLSDAEDEVESDPDAVLGTKPKPKASPSKTYIPQTHAQYVADKIESERLFPGALAIKARQYLLRPEAIESVFYMYRITGKDYWRRQGLKMFMAIEGATKTQYGNSAIYDVTAPKDALTARDLDLDLPTPTTSDPSTEDQAPPDLKRRQHRLQPGGAMDETESFWPAETLKYFFLLFSEQEVVSLDDFVFNTEAHPFLRPDASAEARRGVRHSHRGGAGADGRG